VSESHPELVFYMLSPVGTLHSKKTPKGVEERLKILSRYEPRSHEYYCLALEKFPRKLVARDDVLDAMALMVLGSTENFILRDSVGEDESGLKIGLTLPKTS
jgi:predicted RNase H-like nuclease